TVAGRPGQLPELAGELRQAGIATAQVARRADSEADSEAMVSAAVQAHGGLGILVVASGINNVSPISDMSPERYRAVMQANVDSTWLTARAAGRRMIEQGR